MYRGERLCLPDMAETRQSAIHETNRCTYLRSTRGLFEACLQGTENVIVGCGHRICDKCQEGRHMSLSVGKKKEE